MPERRSESAFNKGLQSVARGDFLEALALFEACMEMEGRTRSPLQIAAMSHYGLCLAMASDRLRDAREICEATVESDPDRPDLYLNLGRVCLRQGDRAHAFRTFVRGLRLDPNHPGLVEALRRLGFRRRPVIAFLPRHHPVNQLLGSLRAAWVRRARPGRKVRARAA
ncbi:MAG TPA: tetratricopeptide repeat protein [Candidatus Cryosericum sp.]|nr:tetratricopeptide repeat protein [Candidatus Cryosericum sp.]